MTNRIFTAAALCLAVPALAACGGEAAPAQQEDGMAGVAVTDARMVPNAVEGNPAAVYFDLSYEGDRATALSRVDVKGAKSAMVHKYGDWNGEKRMVEAGRLPLRKGDTLTFEPGGLHVMAMEPSADLKAGGSTEMTLHFSGGKEVVVPVTIQAPGEDR